MLFLLNNLLHLFSFGKYFLKSLKNSFPMFVETWLLKGGLYQMMLRFLFTCLLIFLCVFNLAIMFSLLHCFDVDRDAKENQQTSKQKNRKRNIIWYNPPFNNQVSTNIGKEFFKLLRKYFPKENKFNKLFNKNNIKISYGCTRNM